MFFYLFGISSSNELISYIYIYIYLTKTILFIHCIHAAKRKLNPCKPSAPLYSTHIEPTQTNRLHITRRHETAASTPGAPGVHDDGDADAAPPKSPSLF